MRLRLAGYLFLCLTFFYQPLMLSQTIQPDDAVQADPLMIIKTATTDMIEQLQLNKKNIAEDPTVVMAIVEELLIPHLATNTISRKVLAKHVRKLTKEQKTKFAEAFRFYMIRFYAKIFASYTDQTFKYLPAPDYSDKKRITIKTRLIQDGSKPVSIDYKMQRSGNSWKIIDLKIEGISMVISNKKQFGNQISKEGIDTVIAKLQYKNNKAKNNE